MSNNLTMNKMKKLYIIMMLLLAGIMVEAQTSVWDGSRKLWTRGSGTEGDPYLIETAAQLAFLSYMVNKDYDTQGLYFRLTTDIDLNGSEDQPWIPIGLYNKGFDEDGCDRGVANNASYYAPRTMFRGCFDGGGHRISNIYVDNEGGYAGLFGYADSWVAGDTVVIENVFVTNGYIKGDESGGIVGHGGIVIVSRCRNGADIEGNSVGGIMGVGGKMVSNCSNIGRLKGVSVGGIAGMMSAAEISECFNEGDVEASRLGGGILSNSNRSMIDNCYNIGNVSAIGDTSTYYPAAGGLLGIVAIRSEAKNSYSVGEITGNHHVGCLLGFASQPENTTFENCYYLNVCSGDEYGIPKSAEEMREEVFVDVLNQGGGVWGFDANNVNDGFPILVRTDLSVESNEEQQLMVFPNPVKDMVSIEGRNVAEIEVYNVLGAKVKSFTNTNRINVEDMPKGVYLLRIADSEGNFFLEKIIKE